MSRKPFARGLVVGKFAPLHRGHELVIRRALESCEKVYILSYSNPEFPGCEPDRRQRWLDELFPEAESLVLSDELLRERLPGVELPPNTADDTTQRRFVGAICHSLFQTTVDAVFTSEQYGAGFAAELTAYFRRRNPKARKVAHVMVDQARREVPVSGTLLRSNPHLHRRWMSPAVYASYAEPICLLGGESSGKSTLAAALAEHFHTVHVPEYGRTLWEEKNGALAYCDMLRIAEKQVALEEAARRQANRFVFCDTSPLTTLFYSRHLFERADAQLVRLADRRYRLAILCEPDFPFVQDGTRRDSEFRELQHAWYLEELVRREHPMVLVSGTIEERIQLVIEILGDFVPGGIQVG